VAHGALSSAIVMVLLAAAALPAKSQALPVPGKSSDQVTRHAPSAGKQRFTVADSIESSRLLAFFPPQEIRYSPDGGRYLAIVANGDLQRDGVWARFITGGTQSLDAAEPKVAARLFTHALGNVTPTYANQISWLGNDGLAFLWHDEQGAQQAMSLDLATGELRQLTRHPGGVLTIAVSPKGRAVLYTAFAPHDDSEARRMRERGFAVRAAEAAAFLNGDIDGWDPWQHVELYVTSDKHPSPRKIAAPSTRGASYVLNMEFSSDGRHALAQLPTDRIPQEWDRYTDHALRSYLIPLARQRPENSRLSQLFVVDTELAVVRELWSAPASTYQRFVWSPDGRSVLMGPTFLPAAQADAAGLEGIAVAEIDIASGRFTQLRVPAELAARKLRPVRWEGDVVELQAVKDPGVRVWFRKQRGQWRLLSQEPTKRRAPVRIEVRQDLNTSPVLQAVDGAAGRERKIFELNPRLQTDFTLGHVELVHWQGADGIKWTGRLYHPVDGKTGRRYPLVIQTHGYSPTAFSLIGDDDYPSVFAAQALANRNIAVLQMGDPDPSNPPQAGEGWTASPREGKVYMRGFEGVVKFLQDRGLVDPARVGLSGFSRTGWHVEYAVAHSDMRFAAALAADNIDSNYVQHTIHPVWAPEFAMNNGAEPFGAGMKAWLEEAPAFQVERIRTPLRLQFNSGGLPYALTQWEMFSRLTYLKRPVELYVIPKVEQGTHNLQNPAQVLASAGGAVDWFDFWLNDRDSDDFTDPQQFARWQKLRELRDAASKEPIPPRLEWQATPVSG